MRYKSQNTNSIQKQFKRNTRNISMTISRLVSIRVARRCDDSSTLWRHCWQESSKFLCTKIQIFWRKPRKQTYRQSTSGNVLSDAPLMSRFQNFAASAAKKNRGVFWKRASRSFMSICLSELNRGQRFWEVVFFKQENFVWERETQTGCGTQGVLHMKDPHGVAVGVIRRWRLQIRR